MGNCHPEKSNVDRGEAEVDNGFRGVRAWFHNSTGDIGFYQRSLSQSQSTILH